MALCANSDAVAIKLKCFKKQARSTFVVYEDIAIKSVPKQQDILRVFKIDICSGEQVGVQTEEKTAPQNFINTFVRKQNFLSPSLENIHTFDLLGKTQSSHKMGVDSIALLAVPLTGWVGAFESPPISMFVIFI